MRVLRVFSVVLVVGGLWWAMPVQGGEGPAPPTLANQNPVVPPSPPCEDHASSAEVTCELASPPEGCPQDFTGGISLFDDSQWAYPATDDHSSLVIAPIALSPRPFVHARQTVRTSERMAEIWVSLPKDSQSSVSVNFVEYPPEGEFRIFRTKLNSQEPRRFYLSAKRWDEKAKKWMVLSPKRLDAQSNDWQDLNSSPQNFGEGVFPVHPEQRTLACIDLHPGQREIIAYTDPLFTETAMDVHSIHSRLNDIEAKIDSDHRNLTSLVEQAKSSLESQSQSIQQESENIGLQIADVQRTLAPQESAITEVFGFKESERSISAQVVVLNDGIKSVKWSNHPQKLNITSNSIPRSLPHSDFTAHITFMIQEGDQEPFKTLAPIPVVFHTTKQGFDGEVDFNALLDKPLGNALLILNFPAENLRLAARMEFTLDHGELGPKRVAGNLRDKINLTIKKKP